MPSLDIDSIIEKIKIAEPESPIAVFYGPNHDRLDALFANTVMTQRWIRDGSPPLLGIYHNRMDIEQIRRFMLSVIEGLAKR